MIPHFFIQIERFSLTLNGKIDISKLPSPLENNQSCSKNASTDEIEDIDKTQYAILNIVQEYTDYPLTKMDNLLHIGINSLNLIRFLSKLSQQFGIDLFFRDLMKNPTVFLLDAFIKNHQKKHKQSNDDRTMNKLSYQQKRIILILIMDKIL